MTNGAPPRGPLDDRVDEMIAKLTDHCTAKHGDQSCLERELPREQRCIFCESAGLHRFVMKQANELLGGIGRNEAEYMRLHTVGIMRGGGYG